jgi:group I intron endonuclease
MPYVSDIIGVYKIVNMTTGHCYVGQSQGVKKRIHEHFRLLRSGKHINPKLQHAFTKYGEPSFKWSLEVQCENVKDLDAIEEAFLCGRAQFEEPNCYNIAEFSKAPMRGKQHTHEAKEKMSASRLRNAATYTGPAYIAKLSKTQQARYLNDPKYRAKLKFVVDHPEMSYAARARAVGGETSSVRRQAIKHAHLKGLL